jgi:hypothetical protein
MPLPSSGTRSRPIQVTSKKRAAHQRHVPGRRISYGHHSEARILESKGLGHGPAVFGFLHDGQSPETSAILILPLIFWTSKKSYVGIALQYRATIKSTAPPTITLQQYLSRNIFCRPNVRMTERPAIVDEMWLSTGDFNRLSSFFVSRNPTFNQTSRNMNKAEKHKVLVIITAWNENNYRSIRNPTCNTSTLKNTIKIHSEFYNSSFALRIRDVTLFKWTQHTFKILLLLLHDN